MYVCVPARPWCRLARDAAIVDHQDHLLPGHKHAEPASVVVAWMRRNSMRLFALMAVVVAMLDWGKGRRLWNLAKQEINMACSQLA